MHTRATGNRAMWDSPGIALYVADWFDGVSPADEEARAFAQCAVIADYRKRRARL